VVIGEVSRDGSPVVETQGAGVAFSLAGGGGVGVGTRECCRQDVGRAEIELAEGGCRGTRCSGCAASSVEREGDGGRAGSGDEYPSPRTAAGRFRGQWRGG